MQLNIMKSHKRQQGVSLITSLVVIALVAAVILIMTGRTINELKHSRDNSGVVQTLLLARGGTRLGQDYLYSDHLKDLLKNSLTKLTKGNTNRWFFGDNTFAIPSEISVATAMKPLAADLQTLFDQDLCGQDLTPTGTTSKIRFRIYVTRDACGMPLPTQVDLPLTRLVDGAPRGVSPDPKLPPQEQRQTYALPFILVAEGEQGIYKRNIALQGELRFTAGKSTFSRYAYFTNEDAEANLWFNTNTLINGPVHTNSHFRFDGTPWFGSTVSTAGCSSAASGSCGTQNPGAHFSVSGGFVGTSSMSDPQNPSFNGTTPTMVGGVDWNANYIELPKNNLSQKYASQGRNKDNTADLASQGLYFSSSLYSLTLKVANINGNFLAPNSISADGTPLWTPTPSDYQYVEACTAVSVCETYRIGKDKIIYRLDTVPDPDMWVTVGTRPFNGVIYSDGKIDRLTGPSRTPATSTVGEDAGPAIAAFSEITVASDTHIRITGDLKYEQPPHSGIAKRNADGSVTSPTDINEGALNVLGVYSAGGDILIGNGDSDNSLNAPKNAMVHASLMASTGKIRVERYNNGIPQGDFQLIGGMIQTQRGPFGQFSGSTMTSGFARTYTYDQRFMMGISPPFFPTAGESDPDNIFVFTYGQREQVF